MTMATARTQRKQVKAAHQAIAEADAFISTATTAAKEGGRKRRSSKDGWPCTAEEITAERDGKGLSWRRVAANLGLGGPGQARKAYTELTGKAHNTSQAVVRRAPKGKANAATLVGPGWDDDTDQDIIEATLNGPWIEAEGNEGSKNYMPAHWTGSTILVERRIRGTEQVYTEEVHVSRVLEFTFGPEGDQPLQVWVAQKDTSASRCFFVTAIKEVQ